MQWLESKLEETLEKTPRKSRRKNCEKEGGSANRKSDKTIVLQQNIIPAHKHAAEKGARSDPYDDTAAQKD